MAKRANVKVKPRPVVCPKLLTRAFQKYTEDCTSQPFTFDEATTLTRKSSPYAPAILQSAELLEHLAPYFKGGVPKTLIMRQVIVEVAANDPAANATGWEPGVWSWYVVSRIRVRPK